MWKRQSLSLPRMGIFAVKTLLEIYFDWVLCIGLIIWKQVAWLKCYLSGKHLESTIYFFYVYFAFKLARVVNINLFFMDWFRQSSIVSEKPGYLAEKLKTLTSSSYHRVQYILLKLRISSLLTNFYKTVLGIFFILFRSWVICKNKKNLVSTHSFFTLSLITPDLNKI